MDAVISGCTGKALIILEDRSLASMDVREPNTLIRRREEELPFLFGDANDLILLENVEIHDIKAGLQNEFEFACALDLILLSLDSDARISIREDAVVQLERLLLLERIAARLRKILYSTPLPHKADVVEAIRCCERRRATSTAAFLQNLQDDQAMIEEGVELKEKPDVTTPVVRSDEPKQSLFMSYARFDDEYQGRLTEFRERLSAEIRMQTGKDFPIFQDQIHIKWGENWKQRITAALDEVFFLIPIITPNFFKSQACRAELEYFLEREKRLHRQDLIFPIYYIGRELLSNPKQLVKDRLVQAIASRQYADWREMRFEPFTSPPVGQALAQLAIQIGDALERAYASADSTEKATVETSVTSAKPSTLGSIDVPYSQFQLNYLRRRSSKNEPPTLVVDQAQSGYYSNITGAIKAADPGDRIVILPGVYEEGIVIDKPLEIIGIGRLEKIVVRATGQNIISFKTTFGRVVNLTLQQMGGGDWFGVDISQGRLELEGCDISSQGLSCVAVHGGADPRIRRNQIHGGKATGIIIYDNSQGTLEDNEIFGTALAGVAITNGGNPTLRRNRIHDCEREGIIIYDKGQGIIEDNSIYGNIFSGVEIKVDSTPLLRRNRIYNGKAGGIYIHQNAQGMLEDNDIFGNSLAGVAIKTGANPTLRHNFIHDGKRSGIFVNENGEGMIEDNDIFGNGYSGVEIKNGGNPTVRYNRIKDNRHKGVWIGEGGAGTINNNDLRDNGQDAFYVSTDSEPKVTRERNLEK